MTILVMNEMREESIMKTAAVAELKASLSKYLAQVKGGGEILITERGKPVARLVPVIRETSSFPPHLLDLARAGLVRLGLESRIAARLDTNISLPAVGQGVIGIECRADDSGSREALHALNDPATRTAVDAERAFAHKLGGSCQSPIAAYAQVERERVSLVGLVAEPDGSRLLRDTISGSAADAQVLGEQLAERVLAAGAGELLQRLRTA